MPSPFLAPLDKTDDHTPETRRKALLTVCRHASDADEARVIASMLGLDS